MIIITQLVITFINILENLQVNQSSPYMLNL